jgi:hypothetical protein
MYLICKGHKMRQYKAHINVCECLSFIKHDKRAGYLAHSLVSYLLVCSCIYRSMFPAIHAKFTSHYFVWSPENLELSDYSPDQERYREARGFRLRRLYSQSEDSSPSLV